MSYKNDNQEYIKAHKSLVMRSGPSQATPPALELTTGKLQNAYRLVNRPA